VRYVIALLVVTALLTVGGSCALFSPLAAGLPVNTQFVFMNFSTRYYAVLALREHNDSGELSEFNRTSLLPPGASFRADFIDFTEQLCPASLDFQLCLYRRVNDGMDPPIPIGLDEGEQVESVPIVAGQIDNMPGPCAGFNTVGIYTVINWDAPTGTARVKFAQDSAVDEMIRDSGRFSNVDSAWELTSVDPELASEPPPSPMPNNLIAGRITLPDGSGVEDIGVLLRTKYRVRLDDADASNDPDSGFSNDPIDFTMTDSSGVFRFERPPGIYQIECFSDHFGFRPSAVEIESPLETIWIIAEPL